MHTQTFKAAVRCRAEWCHSELIPLTICLLTIFTSGSRGGTGGPDPLENYKNIGFLGNTGPNPLKITKLPI